MARWRSPTPGFIRRSNCHARISVSVVCRAEPSGLAATPHPEWFNFTAVGGALLYFGARRSWREMLAPLAVLMATDYFLTVSVYHYSFQWQAYLPTWAWYLAAMVLGQILLRARTTFVRVAAGALLGPTSFFPDLELCGLAVRPHVSAHAGRPGRLLRGGVALLVATT